MADNIFLQQTPGLTFGDYLQYDSASRGNLGPELPVMVYRMLEYSLKDELIRQFGKEKQIEIFRNAGRKAGEYFASQFLDLTLPMDAFISNLQQKMQELKIGVLRIEDVNEENGRITLTVSEDADCSGLPVLGETVCNYDEGFISGILSRYSGKPYSAIEIDCWATGDRVCRFLAEIKDDTH